MAQSPTGDAVAVRFTRKEDKKLSVAFSLSAQELLPKYDEGLHRRRYLPAREDVWTPFTIRQGTSSIEYLIQPVDFKNDHDPGVLPPFDAQEIQMIANTVARLGKRGVAATGGKLLQRVGEEA